MMTELAAGVWWLRLGRVSHVSGNGYLVDDEGTLTLVDAGLPWSGRAIRTAVTEAGHSIAEIERVLVTHYDLDHVGGLACSLSDLDATLVVGDADARLASGEYDPPWLHHKGAFHRLVRRLFPLPDLPVERATDGATFGGFVAYHTPGHNPGHTVYVHEDLGVALLGDLVWTVGGELTPPVWLDSYDMDAVAASIHALASRAPPFDLACVGHGRPLARDGRAALRRLAATL